MSIERIVLTRDSEPRLPDVLVSEENIPYAFKQEGKKEYRLGQEVGITIVNQEGRDCHGLGKITRVRNVNGYTYGRVKITLLGVGRVKIR